MSVYSERVNELKRAIYMLAEGMETEEVMIALTVCIAETICTQYYPEDHEATLAAVFHNLSLATSMGHDACADTS